jgi:hypothetical protein
VHAGFIDQDAAQTGISEEEVRQMREIIRLSGLTRNHALATDGIS